MIDEKSINIFELLSVKNNMYDNRANSEDKNPAIIGLKIQLETSKTMQETFNSLNK